MRSLKHLGYLRIEKAFVVGEGGWEVKLLLLHSTLLLKMTMANVNEFFKELGNQKPMEFDGKV